MGAANHVGPRPPVALGSGVPLDDPAFLRAVLEAIPAVVVRLDSERRINYINHLRAGLTVEQVVGRPAVDFVAPADRAAFGRAVDVALGAGEACTYEARGSHRIGDGDFAHYQCHAAPIDHGEGRRDVCIIATDVSERVARTRELERSQEQLRVAVEATGIGLWTWDVATDRIEYDPRFAEVIGCEPATAREYVERVVHPEDRERVARGIEDTKDGHANFSEYRVVRPDGEVRWVLPVGRLSRDLDGRVVRLTGGTLDVTARRKTEEHLRSVQKLDAIGSLTAGVAHNFNNMLAVIVPALERAVRSARPTEAGLLEDGLHAAKRAAELIAQLKTFAGQRAAPAMVSLDLGPLVERAVSLCLRTFDGRIPIVTTVAPNRSEVVCDPAAIEQIVVNLLINARHALQDAARPNPRIGVEVFEVDRTPPLSDDEAATTFVCIRVEDNGVGMSDEVQERLFEPFFTTKGPDRGTGLGLATSYGIARDHGGFISFDSELGVGTRAEVFLPCARPAAEVQVQSFDRDAAAVAPGRVLIVDDEPAVGRVVHTLLREWGHEARVATDGPDAISAIDAGFSPDLILLDRYMPRWSVERTIDEIRGRLPNVPLLFVTGHDVTSEERQHVQDVLYKPFGGEELKHLIDRWLARRPRVE